jgi:ParB family chromosome partitioning protein
MKIENIDISKIDEFKDHPFQIRDDDSFLELKQSIKCNGLLIPVLLRDKENGRYEMISGHRRLKAMKELGLKTIPSFIKSLSNDQAVIEMVDSNMYREKILPSEKAFAYKMKLDALKHQGKTTDQKGPKLTVEKIGKDNGDSSSQVKRYVRLTYLIPELLQLVDDTVLKDRRTALTMGINPAVELSYLTMEEQKTVYMGITYEDLTPSLGQAVKIRELAKSGKLSFDSLEEILCEEKGNQKEQISFNKERIEKALPGELLKRDKRYIEQYILKAIDFYKTAEHERGDGYDIDL